MNDTNERAVKMAAKAREATQESRPSLAADIESERHLAEMLAKHRTDTLIQNNINHEKHMKAELEIIRDPLRDLQRTTSMTSMISYLSGVEEDEKISKTYKYITASVLWFCYFSLVCIIHTFIINPLNF